MWHAITKISNITGVACSLSCCSLLHVHVPPQRGRGRQVQEEKPHCCLLTSAGQLLTFYHFEPTIVLVSIRWTRCVQGHQVSEEEPYWCLMTGYQCLILNFPNCSFDLLFAVRYWVRFDIEIQNTSSLLCLSVPYLYAHPKSEVVLGQDNFCPCILAGGQKTWPGCYFGKCEALFSIAQYYISLLSGMWNIA